MSELSDLLDEWDHELLLDEDIRPIRGWFMGKTEASANHRSRLRAALMERDGIYRRTAYTTRST
jgi:hypothetical protein